MIFSRKLCVYPNTYYENFENKDQVIIVLGWKKSNPCHASFNFSIIDELGNEKHTKSGNCNFDGKNRFDYCEINLISRAELFDKKNGLLKDNTLTLAGEIKIVNKSKFVVENLESKETDQLHQIYREKVLTDLEIKVKDRSLKVHKVLLAASSSVLRQRLLELPEGSALKLNGLDAEVAEEMINFIYDGRVKDMEKHSKELLVASEQYRMERLKKYCENYFFENLSDDNVFKTLKLSIKTKAEELKEECLEFMKE
jgi:hypothetical protein